jgi:hypothetical protein
MAKLTWRGPDDYEAGETPPSSCTWAGITFPVGVAVEVDNPTMIAKAKGNRMFKVEGEPSTVLITGGENLPVIEPSGAKAAATQWREPETEADPADVNFFDDPPGVDEGKLPPDYPPEDEPKRGRGRPRKVTTDGNSQ